MPAPGAGGCAGSGAGVRRPSGEEAAVSPRGVGRLRRGYGVFCVFRRVPSGRRAGDDDGHQCRAGGALERPRRGFELGAEPRDRWIQRLSAVRGTAGLEPWPKGGGGAALGVSVWRRS